MWASACEIADTMLYLHTGEYNSLLEKVVQVPNRLPSFSIMSSKQYHFNSLSHCYYLKNIASQLSKKTSEVNRTINMKDLKV